MTPPFLFIVGYGRSGTTLLRAMIDAHSDVAIPDESHFVVPMTRSRRRYARPGGFDRRAFVEDLLRSEGFRGWNLPAGWVRGSFEEADPSSLPDAIRLAYDLYARSLGKPRYGDKTPIHVLHVSLIASLFPEARFVHVIRDGRDVAASYLQQPFGPRSAAEAAFRWKRAVRGGRRAGADLGRGRYREVRYEDLVSEPEVQLRALCTFLDLGFEDAMLRYYETDRIASERPHYRSVSLPPTPGIRDWSRELAPGDVEVFELLAGDLLRQLGYRVDTGPVALGARLRARGRWAGVQVRRVGHRLRKAFLGVPTLLNRGHAHAPSLGDGTPTRPI